MEGNSKNGLPRCDAETPQPLRVDLLHVIDLHNVRVPRQDWYALSIFFHYLPLQSDCFLMASFWTVHELSLNRFSAS